MFIIGLIIGVWLLVVCIGFVTLQAIRTYKNNRLWPYYDVEIPSACIEGDDDPLCFLILVWPLVVFFGIPALVLYGIQESVTFCGTIFGKLLIKIFRKEKK